MCGIGGRLALGDGLGDRCARGVAALAERGPDERGTGEGAGGALGMTRLSIGDRAGGHQPMWDPARRFAIVYNGELYNHRELRTELATRWRFRTTSDTEVMLAAYATWGAAALPRCNGMFALAVWDDAERELFLARDRLGEKPLYVHRGPGRFAFASEIKALLADPSIDRAIDPQGLANYLTFGHAVAPTTMFRGIEKLPPGHTMRVRGGRVSTARWWDL